MIVLKTDREIEIMREANRIAAVILSEVGERIRPGVSTYELDAWAEKRIVALNALPAFKGYRRGNRIYPATLCTSINEEVVHGIPSKEKILRDGDIIGIDVGVRFQEYYGDGAWTFEVGAVSPAAHDLLITCLEALNCGLEQAVAGKRISDISQAVERTALAKGFSVVRDLSGHGIGRELHEEPEILNFFSGQKGSKLKRNMTLAIEPMITAGGHAVKTLEDHWTVVTVDGSLSAHFEHTVAVTDNGPEILTRL